MLNMMLIPVVSRLINEKRRWDGKPSGSGVSFVKGWGCISPLLGGYINPRLTSLFLKVKACFGLSHSNDEK